MSDIGQRLVERLDARMIELKCPVRFREQKTLNGKQVEVVGCFTLKGVDLCASTLCLKETAWMPEMVEAIVKGYYNDWLRKTNQEDKL